MIDPRWFQIISLSLLLLVGKFALHFDLSWLQIALTMVSVFLFQWIGSKAVKLPRVEYKSAAISGLSLCLLLRTNILWLVVAGAAIAILSKFFIRVNGKHIFNPTNLGIAMLLFGTDEAWVSPGQWGSATVLAFAIVCFGGVVVFKALRNDVALMFIASFAAMIVYRAAWLGDPAWIPVHQLESGALLIFTFFMISDPKTTPNARSARFLYAVVVAAVAYHFRFRMFDPNALIYALVLCSPLVPLLDLMFRDSLYYWNRLSSAGMKPAGSTA